MTADEARSGMRFAAEPGRWEVTLTIGETLHVLADGYSLRGEEYVFTILIEGRPPFEVQILRLPHHLVRSVYGG